MFVHIRKRPRACYRVSSDGLLLCPILGFMRSIHIPDFQKATIPPHLAITSKLVTLRFPNRPKTVH